MWKMDGCAHMVDVQYNCLHVFMIEKHTLNPELSQRMSQRDGMG